MYNKYIDNGIDLNKDRHCDIEGWFVDNEGHHKPVLRDRGMAKFDKAFKNRYDLYEIVNSFDAKSKLGDTDIDSLHTYSLPSRSSSRPIWMSWTARFTPSAMA